MNVQELQHSREKRFITVMNEEQPRVDWNNILSLNTQLRKSWSQGLTVKPF